MGIISIFLSIAVAVTFYDVVKGKIMYEQEFSGVIWGLICGILGIGFIPAILAHHYLRKNIEKIEKLKEVAENIDEKYDKDNNARKEDNLEPYAQYARRQLKDFFITYWICIIIVILLLSALEMAK